MLIKRHPVLAYSTTTEERDQRAPENANSVLRRMWDMYETDFNKMVLMRQKHYRPPYQARKFKADFFMRTGRKRKDQRMKRQYQEEWLYWMRTEGRKKGLTEPVVFNGPKLGHLFTEEIDQLTEKERLRKALPATVEEMKEDMKNKKKVPSALDRIPPEVADGMWVDDPDADMNIFRLWKRPMHKWPYDLLKRGKNIVRGLVF